MKELFNLNDIPAIVIHDDRRLDRKAMMDIEFPKFFGPDKLIHIQPAIIDRFSNVGIMKAHQACIQFAKDNNFPYILILEDDVRFSDKSRAYADKCFKYMHELDWDILVGGVYTMSINKQVPYWAKIQHQAGFSGLHFYIVRAEAYDKLLNLHPSRTLHYDRWMGSNNNCWCAWPMFATQHPGYSDNVKRDANYEHLLQRFKIIDNKSYWV